MVVSSGSDESAGEEAGDGQTLVYEVSQDEEGERLDVALSRLGAASRSQAQRWIDAGRVLVDGATARRSSKVSLGMILEATPPPRRASEVLAEDLPLSVLHEDADLLVLDKAAGMVVHPAPGHSTGTLVNALLHHCQGLATIGGVERPGIVHRLDRGTSGVMVVAKNDAAHAALAEQFHDHSVERLYRAIVRATPGQKEGRLDRPIGRHPRDRQRMSVRTRSGRSAVTNWRVEARFPRSGAALLEIRPETGRTHQIRVHLAAAGLPIWGDPVYGKAKSIRADAPLLERPALHAVVLGFRHPTRGEVLRFETPLPPDLEALVGWLGEREQ
ncbi:MAG: RluA family pseudouridine synthase [Myxococcota bacterium]|nr:RluA family pseudouridine synthase [Myxococcota bacterium]